MSTSRLLAADPRVEKVIVVVTRGTVTDKMLRDVSGLTLLSVDATGRAGLLRRLAWEACPSARSSNSHKCGCLGQLLRDASPSPEVPHRMRAAQSGPGSAAARPGCALAARRHQAQRTSRRSAACAHMRAGEFLEPAGETDGARRSSRRRPADLLPAIYTRRQRSIYVSDFHTHKRHDVIIKAWARMTEPRPVLRLIGDPGPDPVGYERAVRLAREIGGDRIEISSADRSGRGGERVPCRAGAAASIRARELRNAGGRGSGMWRPSRRSRRTGTAGDRWARGALRRRR